MLKNFPFVALLTVAVSLAQIASAADISAKDRKYISETAQGLMAEIQMGGMAQKQAHDSRVKDFGKRMVDDHGKELQELKQLASQKNVTLPDAPNHEQKKESEKLSHLSGNAFDREYVKYEAKDHKKDVKDQGKEMKETADPDLKKFATSAHETVTDHRKIVDELQEKIGK
jgi:putative membrane protein